MNRKTSVSLKNCFIDSKDPLNIEEIGKDESHTYSIVDILKPFFDTEGVNITISTQGEVGETNDEI